MKNIMYTINKKLSIRPLLLQEQQGLSLIELLVSIGLLAILGGIGVSIFAIINTSYNQSQALSKMQTQGSQVLEVIERSIRGSSNVQQVGNGQNGCTGNSCLVIEVPTSSLEYQINGGCNQTVYAWRQPNVSQSKNGSLVRYYLNENNAACGTPSTEIELFDTNPSLGVSIERLDGDNVFTIIQGSNNIDAVEIAFNLSTGVNITNGTANVPLRTTVGLRDY